MDEDYEVVAVGNGDDALEQLDEITPDFVIADVHMPGANGYDVAKHSKSLRPEVPVLLLVGTFEPFDEEQAEKSGCDAYLKKPFDSQELQRLVEELSAEAARDAGPLEATGWRAESPVVTGADAASQEGAPTAPAAADSAEDGKPAAEATPFSIGLEDDDEPAPTRVEPPAEGQAASSAQDPAGAPFGLEPGAVGSTAPPEEEPAFDLGGGGDAAPGASQAAPEVAAESAPEPPASAPEMPTEAAPVETAPPEPAPSYTPPVETVEATAEDERPTGPLSEEDVDRIARRIVELLGDRAIRDVAWEVVPDLAEVVIRGRLRELESQVESAE
jgi:CheY-like chemotaxis protein